MARGDGDVGAELAVAAALLLHVQGRRGAGEEQQGEARRQRGLFLVAGALPVAV